MRPERHRTGWRATGRLALLLLLAAPAFSGCAGYRLGTMLPPSLRTVYVPTVVNATEEPLLEGEVTRALLARIRTDGSLRAVGEETADAVLRVTLRRFQMDPIAFERGQAARASAYRLTLTASLVFADARTGDVVAAAPSATGETTVETGGDLSSAKRAGIPTLAEDLARDIVRRVVEAW